MSIINTSDNKFKIMTETEYLETNSDYDTDTDYDYHTDSDYDTDITENYAVDTTNDKKRKENNKCIEESCRKYPMFNIETEKNGIYCAMHKKENMVNVIHKTCIEDGCRKRPFFNIASAKNGLYCCIHKKENMVNVKNKN